MNREKSYYREMREKHIDRKKRIVKKAYSLIDNYYEHDGMYSKGKIHCSCWMCRTKSYDEATMMDKRNAGKQIYSLIECDENTKTLINKIHNRTKKLK